MSKIYEVYDGELHERNVSDEEYQSLGGEEDDGLDGLRNAVASTVDEMSEFRKEFR